MLRERKTSESSSLLLFLRRPFLSGKNMSSTSLSEVCKHLRDQDHPELTPEKVRKRATVVEAPEESGRVVFDIERHRSVLGCRYIEGTKMAACETYWERYVFDRNQESLTREGENVSEEQTPEIEIDDYSLLAKQRLDHVIRFRLENRGDGGYVAKNTVAGSSRVVRSKEEFLEFARDEQENTWGAIPRPADVVLEDRYGYSEESAQEALFHLKSAEVTYVEREARWEWERAAE